MRFARDRLILLALVALDEAREVFARKPGPPPVALRAVVMMLYSIAGRDREAFENFLRACNLPDHDHFAAGRITRSNELHTNQQIIHRALNWPMSVGTGTLLSICKRGYEGNEIELATSRAMPWDERDKLLYPFACRVYDQGLTLASSAEQELHLRRRQCQTLRTPPTPTEK